MQLDVYTTRGESSGEKMKLPKQVFGIEPNSHVVYLAVKAQQANMRQGNAATKTRSMVRGGGRKPWKQKGRGVARAGTIRSPLWVGGGRTFGPHPRDYRTKLPRKIKVLARASVLSDKAKSGKVKLIEDFKIESGKTKELFSLLVSLGVDNVKTLLLLSEYDAMTLRAGRNLPKLQIRVADTASTIDLLNCECLLMQQGAIKKLSGVLKK